MNESLKISPEGLEFISKWEGCILKPYKDIAGLRTIGVGHLILPHESYPDGVAITHAQAMSLLASDVKKCEDAIKSNIAVPLNQNQFDALCSFGFNCGIGVYSNSGVASVLKVAQYDQVPAKLLDWSKAKVNGVLQTVPGLYNRRKSEGELFSKPAVSSDVVIKDYPVVWDKSTLTAAQIMLKRLGLYTLSIDGIWGPGSKKAVTSFASQCGISLVDDPQKGVPARLYEELQRRTPTS